MNLSLNKFYFRKNYQRCRQDLRCVTNSKQRRRLRRLITQNEQEQWRLRLKLIVIPKSIHICPSRRWFKDKNYADNIEPKLSYKLCEFKQLGEVHEVYGFIAAGPSDPLDFVTVWFLDQLMNDFDEETAAYLQQSAVYESRRKNNVVPTTITSQANEDDVGIFFHLNSESAEIIRLAWERPPTDDKISKMSLCNLLSKTCTL